LLASKVRPSAPSPRPLRLEPKQSVACVLVGGARLRQAWAGTADCDLQWAAALVRSGLLGLCVPLHPRSDVELVPARNQALTSQLARLARGAIGLASSLPPPVSRAATVPACVGRILPPGQAGDKDHLRTQPRSSPSTGAWRGGVNRQVRGMGRGGEDPAQRGPGCSAAKADRMAQPTEDHLRHGRERPAPDRVLGAPISVLAPMQAHALAGRERYIFAASSPRVSDL
jgi:hypothetical protein